MVCVACSNYCFASHCHAEEITYMLLKLRDDRNNAEDQIFENIFVRMVHYRLFLRIKFLVHYTFTINKTDIVHLKIKLKCICDIIVVVEKQ